MLTWMAWQFQQMTKRKWVLCLAVEKNGRFSPADKKSKYTAINGIKEIRVCWLWSWIREGKYLLHTDALIDLNIVLMGTGMEMGPFVRICRVAWRSFVLYSELWWHKQGTRKLNPLKSVVARRVLQSPTLPCSQTFDIFLKYLFFLYTKAGHCCLLTPLCPNLADFVWNYQPTEEKRSKESHVQNTHALWEQHIAEEKKKNLSSGVEESYSPWTCSQKIFSFLKGNFSVQCMDQIGATLADSHTTLTMIRVPSTL